MLRLASMDFIKEKIETLAIPVCEDQNIHKNPMITAIIKKAKKLKEFSGKKDDELMLYDLPDVNAARVILRGLGKKKEIDPEALRSMAGKTIKQCIKKELSSVAFAVPEAGNFGSEIASILEVMLEGACLANHLFSDYKGEKKLKELKEIHFLVKPETVKRYNRLPLKVTHICRGTILSRDWINTPSNDKTPEKLAGAIVNLAKKQRLKVQVLDERLLKQKKFGALLAVAAGSSNKPRMVVLEYGSRGARQTVALVGKGVTFDSGGLNIKTGPSIADMKSDMAGAAVVAATLCTCAQLKTKLHIIGAIPIVENMPSGKATRPGDIVRSYAGKTIEIGNTDAEGRLILIDAMSYVTKKYNPHILIDVATLTGACVVALGEKMAGVFSNDDELAASLIASGERTHERCWRMPLPEDYKEMLKSDFADINNMPSARWGGAITAALFLSEFAGDTRWAHVDIAGPAYAKKEDAYCGPGGTGFGVRLLCDFLEKLE